jgi:DnaD/phage-associated family protein
MPKYRQLHTKIIDSFDFNEMPDDFTRVVWMLLTLILDSEGRGIDNPCWIKSKMFPLRYDVTDEQISNAFAWLAEREMIQRYSVNGRRYFCIPTFKDYQSGTQKEAKSLLPSPPGILRTNSGEAPEKVGAAESASASESESESIRPDIFLFYEQEIGPLTAMISDELKQAEKDYPHGWVREAIHEAAIHNKRSWKYVDTILKRWKRDGYKTDNRSNYKDDGYTE